MKPKLTTSEAVYGRISTRNAQRRATALMSEYREPLPRSYQLMPD